MTGIHFDFVNLCYDFNLVDVDEHCIYCTSARKFSIVNKCKERKERNAGNQGGNDGNTGNQGGNAGNWEWE